MCHYELIIGYYKEIAFKRGYDNSEVKEYLTYLKRIEEGS